MASNSSKSFFNINKKKSSHSPFICHCLATFVAKHFEAIIYIYNSALFPRQKLVSKCLLISDDCGRKCCHWKGMAENEPRVGKTQERRKVSSQWEGSKWRIDQSERTSRRGGRGTRRSADTGWSSDRGARSRRRTDERLDMPGIVTGSLKYL